MPWFEPPAGGPKGADPKADPFYRLIGAWRSAIKDGAHRHDRDIYGTDA